MALHPDVDRSASVTSPGSPPVYYRTDLTRASLREIWRSASPSYTAGVAAILRKLLRRPWPATFALAAAHPRIVELADVPERLNSIMSDAVRACRQAGFAPRFGLVVPSVGDQENATIVLSTKDTKQLATVAYSRVGAVQGVVVTILSLLRDGRVLSTTNARQGLDEPPDYVAGYHVGAGVPVLVKRHTARIDELNDIRPVALDDLARRQLMLDLQERKLAFLSERGLLVPMTQAEVERLRAFSPGESQ
jgi:hypothetical protein